MIERDILKYVGDWDWHSHVAGRAKNFVRIACKDEAGVDWAVTCGTHKSSLLAPGFFTFGRNYATSQAINARTITIDSFFIIDVLRMMGNFCVIPCIFLDDVKSDFCPIPVLGFDIL